MESTGRPLSVPRLALTFILHRLEAATSRLEDMASAIAEPPKTNGTSPAEASNAAPVVVAAATSKSPSPPAPKPIAEPLPQIIEDFDSFIADSVQKYVKLSDEIGGVVAEQVYDLFRRLEYID